MEIESFDRAETAKRVIDADPDLLRRRSTAALHASKQAWVHIRAEMVDEIEPVIASLTESGPYAYTMGVAIAEDGTTSQAIATTVDEIRGVYDAMHAAGVVHTYAALVDIRGEWYVFNEGMSVFTPKGPHQPHRTNTCVLFPVSTRTGITGELFWTRGVPFADNPAPGFGAPVTVERAELIGMHDRFLEGLRKGDLDAIAAIMDERSQTSIRDYVADTGTLTELRGKKELRRFYEGFYDKFEVIGLDIMHRIVTDWYLFAELRFTARVRSGPDAGKEASFNVAEFYILAPDGRVIARTGHGTDLHVG